MTDPLAHPLCDDYTPTPLVPVTCDRTEAGWVLTFVRELGHPADQVWKALTDPIEISEWAPFNANRNLGGVGEATLKMVGLSDDDDFVLAAHVTTAIGPIVLEYSWGPDVLRWELEPTDTGTRITLHHTTEDESSVAKVAAGWHLCLDVMDLFLDGHPIGRIAGEDAHNFGWQDLSDGYAQALQTTD